MLQQTAYLDHILTHLSLRVKLTGHQAHTRGCGSCYPLHHGQRIPAVAMQMQNGHLRSEKRLAQPCSNRCNQTLAGYLGIYRRRTKAQSNQCARYGRVT